MRDAFQRMRIAIVSDIHGNLTALEAVLADLRQTAPDLILNGGDLPQGGASPVVVLDRIRDLSKRCGVQQRISEFGIAESAIPRMAKSAMTVTRLLERNVREVKIEDAIAIYRSAF